MANEMRDRLVELFKKIEYIPYLGSPSTSNLALQFTDYALYSICDDLIENGVVVPQWISVKDRLPEVSGRYLTHCNVAGQSLVCILYFEQFVYGFEKDVTHWMPLPEPPKKEVVQNEQ